MSHGDLVPQNIIIELVAPESNEQTDFSKKFGLKLAEYLNIKSLSDIAYMKTLIDKAKTEIVQ